MRIAVMEYYWWSRVGTVEAMRMLVLSNVFRASHPQNQTLQRELNNLPMKNSETREKTKFITQSSLRIKQQRKTQDNINSLEMDPEEKNGTREKCLSNSVDAILSHNDAKSKVICSAKGLLETNLDDLFNDVQKLVGWNPEPKSLGASEPTLSLSDEVKLGSLVSDDDIDDDTASDSDESDEVLREQRICMGARRFGHLLRRVISRNGKFNSIVRYNVSHHYTSNIIVTLLTFCYDFIALSLQYLPNRSPVVSLREFSD